MTDTATADSATRDGGARTILGERFADALGYAARVHRTQTRKGSGVPYVSHLLAVAARVIEDGGDEDEAIAGLLHDAVEDQGGASRLADIRARFGDRVAAIVDATSDTDVTPKPPWRKRKEAYIRHLGDPDLPDGTLRVSAADKLHNARSVLHDHRHEGESIWSRFNAPKEDQLWYHRSVADALRDRLPGRLTDELADTVAALEAQVGRDRGRGRRHRRRTRRPADRGRGRRQQRPTRRREGRRRDRRHERSRSGRRPAGRLAVRLAVVAAVVAGVVVGWSRAAAASHRRRPVTTPSYRTGDEAVREGDDLISAGRPDAGTA